MFNIGIIAAIELSFNIHILLLIILFLILITYTLYIYKTTIPQIPGWKKTILIFLRIIAVIFILSAIFEPLLTFITKSEEQPILAVLIDNSGSMKLKDKTGDRSEILKKILQNKMFSDLKQAGDIRFISFSRKNIYHENFPIDSLTFNGSSTDISNSLKTLKEKFSENNLRSVLLLSDGEYNIGQNPEYIAERFGIPVNIIAIGDSSEQKDIKVNRIITNNIVYKGSRVPVEISIAASGYKNESIDVRLYEENTQVDAKKISIKEGFNEYPVELFFEPKEEGIKKYKVTVSNLNDEITEKNNQKSFFIKVLKNKMKVLLIAGGPSSDVSFIKNACIQDKNIDIKTYIQKSASNFYEGSIQKQIIDSAECLILSEFPTVQTASETIEMIKNAVILKNLPIFFLAGLNLDYKKLKILESFLPFISDSPNANEILVTINVTPDKLKNPILKISGNSYEINIWNKLPPIFKSETVFNPKPESEVIATYSVNGVQFNSPLIISRKMYKHKSIAITGYGIWRWKLLSEGLEETENLFETFLGNSIRWLTTREEDKFLRITPDKEIYNAGEKIELYGQLYNETYEPLDNADILISVKKGDVVFETHMSPLGSGKYISQIENPDEGEYEYTAKAFWEGKTAGEDKGRISIGETNLEFQNPRMNSRLLTQIALRTNGKYYTPENYEEFLSDLKNDKEFKVREVIHKTEIQLWNLYYMLIIIILLLGIEWFLRKRSGLL